jgi:protein-L-isoaspartate(D-aspartate) O-methyltransferase
MRRLDHLSPPHANLVRHLCGSGVLRTPALIDAFIAVDRSRFVPEEVRQRAFEDTALPIGYGATISQPTTVAFMLELLAPAAGHRVLDVGAGSCWQAALLAHVVGDTGKVFAIERVPEVCEMCRRNIGGSPSNITITLANGSAGLPSEAPFDRIIVGAGAKHLPRALVSQLAVGGRLVVPVGDEVQDVTLVIRLSANEYDEERYPGFVFVPLVEQSHG